MRHATQPTVYDAVVVGAGPAGAAVAARLAEQGARVALLDRARFPRPKPCAEYLSPQATYWLDRLGVGGAVRALRPAELRGMRIVSPDRTEFVGRFAGAAQYQPYTDRGFALPRDALDHALVRWAVSRGAELLERTTVAALDGPVPSGRAVVVRSRRGVRLIRGRLIVGADGLNSRVASALGVVRRGRRRRLALVAHAVDVDALQPIGEMHVTPWGYVGLAPLGDGRTNVSVVVDLDRLPRPAIPPGEWFHQLRRLVPELADRLRAARFVTPVRAVGPFARWTRRATGERVLLVGDAADFYDPFTGEGIYAALRGADLAAELLAERLPRDRLQRRDLAPYDAARRRVFAHKWRLERLISLTIAHRHLIDHVARRLAARQRLAELLVAVAGDLVPARAALRPSFVWQLVR